ncbi:MAG: hypothetical protein VW462_08105, partial [Rhodospirillales bacterium]
PTIMGVASRTSIANVKTGIATKGNPIPATPFTRLPRKNASAMTAAASISMFRTQTPLSRDSQLSDLVLDRKRGITPQFWRGPHLVEI